MYKLVTEVWYLHKHTMQDLTKDLVYLQYDVTLYIQRSVSKNARSAVLGSRGEKKYKYFLGETAFDTTPNFLFGMVPFCSVHKTIVFSSRLKLQDTFFSGVLWKIALKISPIFIKFSPNVRQFMQNKVKL